MTTISLHNRKIGIFSLILEICGIFGHKIAEQGAVERGKYRADHSGPLRSQRSGRAMGHVIQPFDGRENSFALLGPNAFRAVQTTRCGGQGNRRSFGDILQCRTGRTREFNNAFTFFFGHPNYSSNAFWAILCPKIPQISKVNEKIPIFRLCNEIVVIDSISALCLIL